VISYLICDSELKLKNVEHVLRLHTTEMSMIRCTCAFTLKERKKVETTELGD